MRLHRRRKMQGIQSVFAEVRPLRLCRARRGQSDGPDELAEGITLSAANYFRVWANRLSRFGGDFVDFCNDALNSFARLSI